MAQRIDTSSGYTNAAKGINTLNAVADVDPRKAVIFDSVTEALENVKPSMRAEGLELKVRNANGNFDKYEFVGGIADTDFKKSDINNAINIEDFGAVGDSITDNSTEFLAALAKAKNQGKKLYIPSGDFLVNYPTGTIDATGCTGIVGDGTLTFDTDAEDEPIMEWRGEIESVSGAVSVTEGENTVTINTGESIKAGQTMFLVSNETKENLISKYKKGQRLTVSSYNDSNGVITFFEKFETSITDGYFYLNSYKPRVTIEDVTIRASEVVLRKGLQFTFSDVVIRDVFVENFAAFCINVSQSYGFLENYKARNFYITESTTSYGLQISGLSKSIAIGLDLKGGRHAITHGDVGEWNADQVGDSSSSIFFGSESKIYASEFSSEEETSLDAHGGTKLVEVYDSYISNGLGSGADVTKVYNSRIEKYNSTNICLKLGRDSNDSSVARGDFYFENITIKNGGALFYLTSSVKNLTLKNIYNVSSYPTFSTSSSFVWGTKRIENLNIDGLKHSGGVGQKNSYDIYINSNSKIKNVDLNGSCIELLSYQDFDKVFFQNLNISNGYNRGLRFLNTDSYLGKVVLKNTNIYNSGGAGIYFNGVQKASIFDSYISGSANIGIDVRGGTDLEIVNTISENNTTRGIYMNNTGDMSYSFLNFKTINNGLSNTLSGTEVFNSSYFTQKNKNETITGNWQFDNPITAAEATANDELATLGQTKKQTLQEYTVATLPASPNKGDQALVTDAATPSWNTTVTGGGNSEVVVWYNGTNWIIH